MTSRELLLSLGNENSSAIFSDAMRQAFLDGAAALGTLEAIKAALAPVLSAGPTQVAVAAKVASAPVAASAAVATPAVTAPPAPPTPPPAAEPVPAPPAPPAAPAIEQGQRKGQGGRRAPWTTPEDELLVAAWHARDPQEPLYTALSRWAPAHGRTPYALALRLAQTHQLISVAQAEEVRHQQYGSDSAQAAPAATTRGTSGSRQGPRATRAESPSPQPQQQEPSAPAAAAPELAAGGPSFTDDLLGEPMGDPSYLTDEAGNFGDTSDALASDNAPIVADAKAQLEAESLQADAQDDRFVHEPSAKLVGLCGKLSLEMELADDLSNDRGRILLDYISHEPLKAFALLAFCQDPLNANKLSDGVRKAAIAALSCLCEELTARGVTRAQAEAATRASRAA